MGGLAGPITLGDPGGLRVTCIPFGATISHLYAPDRLGRLDDVVLTVADHSGPHPYFGSTIGRFANRIGDARFALNAQTHQLSRNEGLNTLHGGHLGFGRRVWCMDSGGNRTVRFTYISDAGEEGFPGTLSAQVTYTVAGNELRIDYEATSSADTIINLTNHTYFNLRGSGTILDHVLWVDADAYTPVGETLIPTGELASVAGTPFDFRTPMRIGARLGEPHPQLSLGRGYDHNWVLNDGVTKTPRRVATLSEPSCGRMLTLFTTEPGLQVYAGTQLDGTFGYQQFGGVALETQHFPDSPNHPHFPSTVLRRAEVFSSTTIWRFEA